jgi:hypothetical protein
VCVRVVVCLFPPCESGRGRGGDRSLALGPLLLFSGHCTVATVRVYMYMYMDIIDIYICVCVYIASVLRVLLHLPPNKTPPHPHQPPDHPPNNQVLLEAKTRVKPEKQKLIGLSLASGKVSRFIITSYHVYVHICRVMYTKKYIARGAAPPPTPSPTCLIHTHTLSSHPSLT